MNKTLKSILCAILLLSLLGSLFVTAFAAEETEEAPVETRELHISSVNGFLKFTKNCVRDQYSKNLTVYLDKSLDLTDQDFDGIPIFTGTFEGNHHTISGLKLTKDGSNLGLFRYLTKGAEIRNLTVKGDILPEGSQHEIGGLVGTNSGTIKNCNFKGEVFGNESVGGIAGTNTVSGVIDSCQSEGLIRGAHFAGGIAGENLGIIRYSKNFSDINITEEDNSIQSVELTPEFLMGKESAETVTDLGGIAGTTTGVIRECINTGTVGYPHMGYNIGGIAGSQRGYITQCKNNGNVSGRKEVGGIAGQMEPVAEIEYSPDTLQILRGQLATTSSLANRASADIRNGSADISADISALHEEAGAAMDAVLALLESGGDLDSIIAANNALSGSIGSMQSIASSLHGSVEATVSSAAGDIRAITRQIAAMSHTLDTAADNLGGTVTDVSDQDQEEDYTAKVSDCENHSEILGDLNVGGIAGAIAWENDKDPEGDFEVSGDQSLNFDSKLRAVILNCKNFEAVTAKKRNAGGIVGNMALGLVKNCTNTGFLECENADYLGGIAGISNGFIRLSSSKTKIIGKSYIGGIAGQAPIITDCRSMVKIQDGSEKLGSIVGDASEYLQLNEDDAIENPIHGNYYLPLADHLGAVDGIDYCEAADSLSKAEFMKLPHLPRIFSRATMTFRFPDGTTQSVIAVPGDPIPREKIPALPEKPGYIAKWDKLEEIDLNNVFLDGTLDAEYIPCFTVAQSSLTREDGKPILLAEGKFDSDTPLNIEPLEDLPQKAEEGWSLEALPRDQITKLRLSVPQNLKADASIVLVQNSQGQWRQVEHGADGSYAVFPVNADDQAAAIAKSHAALYRYLIGGGSALILIAFITVILVRRKKRKQKAKSSR